MAESLGDSYPTKFTLLCSSTFIITIEISGFTVSQTAENCFGSRHGVAARAVPVGKGRARQEAAGRVGGAPRQHRPAGACGLGGFWRVGGGSGCGLPSSTASVCCAPDLPPTPLSSFPIRPQMFVDQMDLTVELHRTFLRGDRQPRPGLSEREKQQASQQASSRLPLPCLCMLSQLMAGVSAGLQQLWLAACRVSCCTCALSC